MGTTSRTRQWILAVGIAAYALVFGEVFLRVMAPQAILPRFVTGTPLGIRGNIPNADYRQWTPETEVSIRINGQGLRADRDFALAKPDGVCRIALLGDSYFLGFENDLEDSIAGRLEQRLERAGHRVEVLNFAVSGFGTAEMLAQFDGRVRDFSPDVTVFQFHASDFRDNVRTAVLFTEDANGAFARSEAAYLPGVEIQDRLMELALYRWAIEHSHLYTAVRERAALLAKDLLFTLRRGSATRDEDDAGDGAEAASAPPNLPAARLTGRLLRAAGERAEAAGSDWFVLEIPTVLSRTRFASRASALDLDASVRAHFVSALPTLERHADPDVKLFYEQGHRHMTPLGNALTAEALAQRILSDSAPRLARCRTVGEAP